MRDLIDVAIMTPQAVTAAAYSSGYKDKGLAALDYANGETVYGMAQVTTTFTDGGSNTGLEVWWADDSSVATSFGSNTPAKLQRLGIFPAKAAVGAATSLIQCPLAPLLTTQQYMGFWFNPTGASLTGGAVIAGFTNDPSSWIAYAAAYTVLG